MLEILQIRGLENVIDALNELPAHLVSVRGGLVKLALAKGARIIRDQARANLIASTSGSSRSTGALAQAIINRRGRLKGGAKGETQVVEIRRIRKKYVVNRKNIRTQRSGKSYLAEGPNFYGRFLEAGSKNKDGSLRISPRGFMRNAFVLKKQQAVQAIKDDLLFRLEKIAQSLLNGQSR